MSCNTGLSYSVFEPVNLRLNVDTCCDTRGVSSSFPREPCTLMCPPKMSGGSKKLCPSIALPMLYILTSFDHKRWICLDVAASLAHLVSQSCILISLNWNLWYRASVAPSHEAGGHVLWVVLQILVMPPGRRSKYSLLDWTQAQLAFGVQGFIEVFSSMNSQS